MIKGNTFISKAHRKVTLPKDVLDVVDEMCCCQTSPCCCPVCEIYLVGSTVLDLLNNAEPSEQKDFDFLMITHSPQWLKQCSFSKFIRNDHITNLYIRDTRQFGGISADLMIKSTTLSDDANARDLSLSAIYVRVNGHPDGLGLIYDPTGRGLSDVQLKRLNTIEPPLNCFNRDPIRVLRAIKYLMRGYTPETKVVDALRQWNAPFCYENDHFIAVLTRQLESPSYFEFVHQLKQYGLVSKMKWANASNDEEHDSIAIKFLNALYLRYYQRTIAHYSVEDREYHVQKKINSIKIKSEQLTQEKTSHQATITQLVVQLDQQKKSFLRKKELINAVATQTALHAEHQKKQVELQHELDELYQTIEKQVHIRLKDNEHTRSAQIAEEQQVLEKTQRELSAVLEKNKQQESRLSTLREQHANAKQRTQNNNEQLQRVESKFLELQMMQAPVPPVNKGYQFEPASEDFLGSLDSDQLENLFYKISFPDFKAIIAYHLGRHAQNEQLYFKALNYFYTALDLAPDNKATQNQINVIKEQCLQLNYSETTAQQWFEKGVVAAKEKKIDEAITYFTFAIQHDSQYVNAYVRRMNIFYDQNHWAAYVADYDKLIPIMDIKAKTATPETLASLDKISNVLKKRSILAVTKQLALLDDVEQSAQLLQVLWWYTVTYKLVSSLSMIPLDVCYKKIIAQDPNKSIEYGMAHFELARCYHAQKKLELAGAHYYEALSVIPCLASWCEDLETFKPMISFNPETMDFTQYLDRGEQYYEQYCYNIAMTYFKTAIANFPKDTQAYWSIINSCFRINQPAWITEEVLDGLIGIYLQFQKENQPAVNYLRPLAELYLYKSDYQDARAVVKLLENNHRDECVLFCSNLNQALSSELVDEIKQRNKQYYLRLYTSGSSSMHSCNWFRVCYELAKVSKDDGDVMEALHYFQQAKALNSQPSYACSYQHVLSNLLNLYITTEQFEAATLQIKDIFMQYDAQSEIVYFAKLAQNNIKTKLAANHHGFFSQTSQGRLGLGPTSLSTEPGTKFVVPAKEGIHL